MDLDGFRFGFEWIWMDLYPQLGLLCCAALPGFLFKKKHIPGILQPETTLKPPKTNLKHPKTILKCFRGLSHQFWVI